MRVDDCEVGELWREYRDDILVLVSIFMLASFHFLIFFWSEHSCYSVIS